MPKRQRLVKSIWHAFAHRDLRHQTQWVVVDDQDDLDLCRTHPSQVLSRERLARPERGEVGLPIRDDMLVAHETDLISTTKRSELLQEHLAIH